MNLTQQEQSFYKKHNIVIKSLIGLLMAVSIALNVHLVSKDNNEYQEGLETGKEQEFLAIGYHLDTACDNASRLMNEICNAQLYEENNSGLYPDVEIIDPETGEIR